MNLQTRYPTTADEFLRWNEGREGKREFVRGRVVEMMINVTRNHWRLSNRLARQLTMQLDERLYDVGTADYGVRTPDGVRFPDVMVDRAGGEGSSLATTTPVLVAEILSKSSIADDFGPKALDYQGLPGLQHYLVLSQDDSRVWAWSRGEGSDWSSPEIIENGMLTLQIDGASVAIDLARLYDGIASPSKNS
jgi:Uma2 family endonuclease